MGLVRAAAWLAAPLLFVACGLDDEGTLEETGGSAGQSGAGGSTAGASAGGVGGSAGSGVGGASGSGVGGTSGAGGSAGTGAAGASGAGGSAGTGAAGAGGSAGTGAAGAGGSAGSGAAGAGGTGGSSTIPSCSDLYMFVTGVKDICNDADPCKLYIDSEGVNGQTCKAICEGKGGECTGAHDISGTVNACTQPSSGSATCTTNDQTNMICFCSRGCGGKPPCTAGQTCDNGNCI